MLVTTHLAVTTIVANQMNLQGQELFLAYLFGVCIDLDHLWHIKALKKKDFWQAKGNYHSWFHEPVGFALIAIGSFIFSSWVALLFYSLHFAMDQLSDSLKKPFYPFDKKDRRYGFIPAGSKLELILSPFALLVSLVIIWFSGW